MAPRNRRDQTEEGIELTVYLEDSGFHSGHYHDGDKVRQGTERLAESVP
jgi:hypothetical protein